jgi:hypothetical protein
MTTCDALDRTLRLMRDDLRDDVSNDLLLSALRNAKILIVADENNARSHSAQCMIVTAASLMARSGLSTFIDVPDVPLAGFQLPLALTSLRAGLLELGTDLVPDVPIYPSPCKNPDLIVALGNTRSPSNSCPVLRIRATAWSTYFGEASTQTWPEETWPIGAIAAGAVAAGEAFKVAMRALSIYAASPSNFEEFYRPRLAGTVHLAPSSTPRISDLGEVDFISAGAISNAAYFALVRIPTVTGHFRIIEPQTYDATIRQSRIREFKAAELARLRTPGLKVTSIPLLFARARRQELSSLANAVLVGVDDIPTRWDVQRAEPAWLGVGATSHWGILTSYHRDGLPCAGCLHPSDDDHTPIIPTVAFVSFWAGLWLAALLLRHRAGADPSPTEQQIYFAALQPSESSLWRSPVSWNAQCPISLHPRAA